MKNNNDRTEQSPPGLCKVYAKKIRRDEDHLRVYNASTYHLVCWASCAAKFEASPAQYLVM